MVVTEMLWCCVGWVGAIRAGWFACDFAFFFSLDSSIVFLAFKLWKISFLIYIFTFVDLDTKPHILDLKIEREKMINSSNGGGIKRDA